MTTLEPSIIFFKLWTVLEASYFEVLLISAIKFKQRVDIVSAKTTGDFILESLFITSH